MFAGKSRRFAVGLALCFLAGIGLAVLVLLVARRDTTPRLTEAYYEAAVERWDQRGPLDYDLDLELFGNRPGKIHVEVRRGQVTHMTRDGVEPRQKRTWDYWSVPGQLDTIGQELDKADNPSEGFQAPAGARMVQKALFDPQFGYPVKYHRIVLGSNLEIRWEVTRFVPLDPTKDESR